MKQTIANGGDVSVFTKAGQEDLLLQGMVDKARRQLGMFRALLTIIAAVIMALILYTLTLDKLHSIALLKLLGAPDRTILGILLQQAIGSSGRTEVVSLREATLQIPKGQVVALLGPSGSGKSTLLTIIGLVIPPTSGQVFISGELIVDGSHAKTNLRNYRRQNVGFVFQKANLIPFLSAIENVQIAMELNHFAFVFTSVSSVLVYSFSSVQKAQVQDLAENL